MLEGSWFMVLELWGNNIMTQNPVFSNMWGKRKDILRQEKYSESWPLKSSTEKSISLIYAGQEGNERTLKFGNGGDLI